MGGTELGDQFMINRAKIVSDFAGNNKIADILLEAVRSTSH